ncbi:MAG: aspartate-semialdehyde dehydrogenase [Prevotellaceae bacterium]|jgi:aspartate-semialdehyde dehydrogenase|nr:aspartate-semialdehyde dehydrogenase [Prevotellaceae bacterium]
MKVAVIGATGLVGTKIIEVLDERNFPISELIPVASEKSAGKIIRFKDVEYKVCQLACAVSQKPALAIFSAGGEVSKEWAPKFAQTGCRVVDNSSYWRMDTTKKLIIPEINSDVLTENDYIIANPNCSTIQMLLVAAPLHRAYTIKRIVVSTYQSVTGSGYKAMKQMQIERTGGEWGKYEAVYPYPIDCNVLPHIDSFTDNGYTKEEMKMVNETHKILCSSIAVSPTTVRVPVTGGHSESVNIEFEKDFDLHDLVNILENTKGVVVKDDVKHNIYPMPVHSFGKDEVFVGRIRRDISIKSGINLWIVADNLRKGAATNAIQIAEKLLEKGILQK